ncbi:MAG: hypothetical protein GF370_03315 [Candidatus Nealsonbacteria bacterium]|nr:hypothetical protein [Candidatus Nealsonbacteria bacterium]
MKKVLLRAKGFAGQIELFENKVRIERKGLMAFLLFGGRKKKEFSINEISSIKFEEAGLTHGYIRFRIGKETEEFLNRHELVRDAFTVFFNIFQQPAFRKIKEKVERKISHVLEAKEKEEKKLKEFQGLVRLRERGVISKSEFEKERKKLLGF